MDRSDKAKSAVEKYFRELMPERLRRLKNMATHDLWYGPGANGDDEEWPGYVEAVTELERWWGEHGGEVWVDMDCEMVFDTEPKPVDEETGEEIFLESVYLFERRDAARAVFGRLISDGGMNV
jgi:hypothetical protein